MNRQQRRHPHRILELSNAALHALIRRDLPGFAHEMENAPISERTPDIIVAGSSPASPGSRPYPCADCQTTVYLQPDGQEVELALTIPVVCPDCCLKRIQPGPQEAHPWP